MKTAQEAAQNYDTSMQFAAQAWNAAKPRMASNYGQRMAEFLGGPVAPSILAKYQAKINSATYRGGTGARWLERYTTKMRGG